MTKKSRTLRKKHNRKKQKKVTTSGHWHAESPLTPRQVEEPPPSIPLPATDHNEPLQIPTTSETRPEVRLPATSGEHSGILLGTTLQLLKVQGELGLTTSATAQRQMDTPTSTAVAPSSPSVAQTIATTTIASTSDRSMTATSSTFEPPVAPTLSSGIKEKEPPARPFDFERSIEAIGGFIKKLNNLFKSKLGTVSTTEIFAGIRDIYHEYSGQAAFNSVFYNKELRSFLDDRLMEISRNYGFFYRLHTLEKYNSLAFFHSPSSDSGWLLLGNNDYVLVRNGSFDVRHTIDFFVVAGLTAAHDSSKPVSFAELDQRIANLFYYVKPYLTNEVVRKHFLVKLQEVVAHLRTAEEIRFKFELNSPYEALGLTYTTRTVTSSSSETLSYNRISRSFVPHPIDLFAISPNYLTNYLKSEASDDGSSLFAEGIKTGFKVMVANFVIYKLGRYFWNWFRGNEEKLSGEQLQELHAAKVRVEHVAEQSDEACRTFTDTFAKFEDLQRQIRQLTSREQVHDLLRDKEVSQETIDLIANLPSIGAGALAMLEKESQEIKACMLAIQQQQQKIGEAVAHDFKTFTFTKAQATLNLVAEAFEVVKTKSMAMKQANTEALEQIKKIEIALQKAKDAITKGADAKKLAMTRRENAPIITDEAQRKTTVVKQLMLEGENKETGVEAMLAKIKGDAAAFRQMIKIPNAVFHGLGLRATSLESKAIKLAESFRELAQAESLKMVRMIIDKQKNIIERAMRDLKAVASITEYRRESQKINLALNTIEQQGEVLATAESKILAQLKTLKEYQQQMERAKVDAKDAESKEAARLNSVLEDIKANFGYVRADQKKIEDYKKDIEAWSKRFEAALMETQKELDKPEGVKDVFINDIQRKINDLKSNNEAANKTISVSVEAMKKALAEITTLETKIAKAQDILKKPSLTQEEYQQVVTEISHSYKEIKAQTEYMESIKKSMFAQLGKIMAALATVDKYKHLVRLEKIDRDEKNIELELERLENKKNTKRARETESILEKINARQAELAGAHKLLNKKRSQLEDRFKSESEGHERRAQEQIKREESEQKTRMEAELKRQQAAASALATTVCAHRSATGAATTDLKHESQQDPRQAKKIELTNNLIEHISRINELLRLIEWRQTQATPVEQLIYNNALCFHVFRILELMNQFNRDEQDSVIKEQQKQAIDIIEKFRILARHRNFRLLTEELCVFARALISEITIARGLASSNKLIEVVKPGAVPSLEEAVQGSSILMIGDRATFATLFGQGQQFFGVTIKDYDAAALKKGVADFGDPFELAEIFIRGINDIGEEVFRGLAVDHQFNATETEEMKKKFSINLAAINNHFNNCGELYLFCSPLRTLGLSKEEIAKRESITQFLKVLSELRGPLGHQSRELPLGPGYYHKQWLACREMVMSPTWAKVAPPLSSESKAAAVTSAASSSAASASFLGSSSSAAAGLSRALPSSQIATPSGSSASSSIPTFSEAARSRVLLQSPIFWRACIVENEHESAASYSKPAISAAASGTAASSSSREDNGLFIVPDQHCTRK